MVTEALIGIVGGHGSVGRVAARQLAAWGARRQRIGGRRLDPARRLIAEDLDGVGEAVLVDINAPAVLARFCEGCRVVVNCAGPSYRVLDRVARAAASAGAEYVDASGDDRLYERLDALDLAAAGRTAVIAAGMMPGLTGLLPRCLAGRGFERLIRLTAYVGGRSRLTETAAADYHAALVGGFGESLAAWHGGRRVSRVSTVLRDAELPFFPRSAVAHPYLSTETERLARVLGLDEVRWYDVFDGAHFFAALGRLQGAPLGERSAELSQAAELDLFGRAPYHLMVFQLDGEMDGRVRSRTLVLRGADATALTGAAAALVTSAVLRGEVAPGLCFAADAVDPATSLDRLRDTPAVMAVEIIDGPIDAGPTLEEGVL